MKAFTGLLEEGLVTRGTSRTPSRFRGSELDKSTVRKGPPEIDELKNLLYLQLIELADKRPQFSQASPASPGVHVDKCT